jgi:anti-sigma B factor antagonist
MTAGGDEQDTATLQVTVDSGDTVVIGVCGEVDYDTADDLRTALTDALDRQPAGVVLDLGRLRFLDSSGIGVIVGGWQRARQTDVRYVLRRVPPVIAEQFEMTGLAQVLTFENDLDAERDDTSAA